MSLTWQEHIAWCKERALRCVERGDLREAWASMKSDFGKHDDAFELTWEEWNVGLDAAREGNTEKVLAFIDGFR